MAFLELTAKKLKSELSSVLSSSVSLYFGVGAHVEGHKGLISLTSEEIIFKFKKGKIIIAGQNLSLVEITEHDAYLGGKVFSINTVGDIDE